VRGELLGGVAVILKDKVAIVTGSGQGMGKAIAIELARAGAKVVVNNRSPESEGGNAEETAKIIKEAGGEAIPIYGNVGQMDVCEKLIKGAVDAWGTIDIVVNNAGINRDRMVWNMSEEEWDAVIDVILKGTFGCTKFAAVHMRAQRKGRIINMTSGAGMDGNAGQPNYSAAKGGIVGFTKSCALALGRYGITVNALSPQADTRMWQAVTPERAREMGVVRGLVTKEEAAAFSDEEVTRRIFGSSEDVAPIVVYLASDLAANINGQIFFASGGRISLYGAPTQIKTIYKKGRWSFEELASVIPGSLASGLVNPAPPEPPS
jgi:NAD(P)-dependent dehydrogenase (short-subunit alcohol dehydrogenase family)